MIEVVALVGLAMFVFGTFFLAIFVGLRILLWFVVGFVALIHRLVKGPQ